MRRNNLVLWILAAVGLGLFSAGVYGLRDDPSVVRYEFTADDANHTPVLALQPRGWKGGPGVILVHGYSGNKEMMQPIARMLARSGMAVYCPDLPGSGNSTEKFHRDRMLPALRDFYRFLLAKGLVVAGNVALAGHSMGGGLVTQLAAEADGVRATVCISNAPSGLRADRPKNLLAMVGDRDLAGLQSLVERMVSDATGGAVSQDDQETGNFADGSARRLLVVEGASHLNILYNPQAIRAIQEWLGRSFDINTSPPDSRWTLWIGIFYSGSFLLFIPVAGLMGAVKPPREMLSFDQRAGWRGNLMVLPAGLIALVILRFWSPLGFVGIEAGSYLASFFLLTGLLRIVLTRVTRTPDPGLDLEELVPSLLFGFAGFLFLYLTFGAVTHRNLFYMLEGAERIRWFAVVALGISPFFIEDEKTQRSVQENHSLMATYFYSIGGKVCVLVAILLSITSPIFHAPRFLLSLAFPFLVVFFLVTQLLSLVLYHFTRRSMATAAFNTFLMAWFLTAPFVRT